jgi:hypothetical protein
MFHSNLQQLIRQDPHYWMSYALAREDNRYQMVSYPYYTKCQGPAEGARESNVSKGFRHIDLNPGNMLLGYGIHQIQGSVSLDDEKAGDCTYMVKGMHKEEKLEQWVDLMNGRGALNASNKIMVIDKKTLPQSDVDELGLEWTDERCKAGDARLTYP